MAELRHQLHPNITIDTSTGTQNDGGGWDYQVKIGDGPSFPLPDSVGYDPEQLTENINNSESAIYAVLNSSLGRISKVSQGPGSTFGQTVSPSLQKTPGNIVGLLADTANQVLAVPDAGINLFNWAFGGFEGEVPQKRYISSDPRNVVMGSTQINRALQGVGDIARAGIRATDEAELNVTIPETWYDMGLGGSRVGAKTLLDPFAFNTTPNTQTRRLEYISLISEIIGSAPVEGAAIAKLANQLTRTTTSPTAELVYEAISEMPNAHPIKAAASEVAMGAVTGAGMVTSDAALEAAYPDGTPPPWMTNVVRAGGGIILPMGVMTAGSIAWDVGVKTPIIKWPLQFARGLSESLTPRGAEKAAARAIQTLGGDWRNRNDILGVTGQLKLALAVGRDMDEATRIAFTTTQLARNEANVLEAQLEAARAGMSADAITAAETLIQDVRRFSNFQEGQLKTLSSGGGIGADQYAKYSERMMDRRDSVFTALDNAILKLDLGGKSDEGVDASVIQQDYDQSVAGNYVYNKNRLRAMQEGRLGDNVTPEQTQAISQAYDNVLTKMEDGAQQALQDAQERIAAIRSLMPEDLPRGSQERLDYNRWIRSELETAYKEIDGYEDVLWNSIGGMNAPKTTSYVRPDGTDMGPQILIDGVPIGEHFAARADALKGGENENQTKWLWKLAGRGALVDQKAKGGGPDAERVAKQNVIVKQNEDNVARLQTLLLTASDNLAGITSNPSVNPELTKTRRQVAKLEAELSAIPDGRTIEDPTVIKRINAVEQKLAGLRETARGLEAEGFIDPALEKANKVFLSAQDNVAKASIALDASRGNLEISLGKGVTDENGVQVDLEKEILDTSALGVRIIDGVPVGREPQELQNIISLLKAESTAESGKNNRKPAKIVAIGKIIDDLQRAIGDPENFSVDTTQLGAAVKMTAAKKALFDRNEVGRIRGYNTSNEPNVELESTLDSLARPNNQEANLRQLEAALTPISSGEGTPFRIVTRDDGSVGPEMVPDFDLTQYAVAPPPPFESIDVDGGRSLGLRVAEGTPPTESSIDIVRNTLWDRFRGFDSGETFDTAGAAKWLDRNGGAIRWLEGATKKDTGFENLVAAERIAKTIANSAKADVNRTVETLRKNGAFNEEFTEEGFLLILAEQRKRRSNLKSAATFLDNPNPTKIGPDFLNTYFNNPNVLGETLKLLDNGALPDGSNPAREGFKVAVAEALIQRSLTTPSGTSKASVEAKKLSDSLDRPVKLWDPDALMGLAQDTNTSRLLGELYGKDAPEMFRKIAEGAQLQSSVGESATPNVARQDKYSNEMAGNFGRYIGGWLSQYTPIPALVATGVGRRASIAALATVRGSAIDRLIVDFLMDPKLAAAAIEKYPLVSPNANESMLKRFMLAAHQKFIGDNARRIERLGEVPGVLYEISAEALDIRKEDEDEGDVGPQASLQQVSPPAYSASAVPLRQPISASGLSNASPVSPSPTQVSMASTPPPTAQGPSSPEVMELGRQLFGANDTVFANQGGYIGRPMEHSGIMSVRNKPRQLVG